MESRSLSELKSEIALHLEEMKSEKFDNEDTSEDGSTTYTLHIFN